MKSFLLVAKNVTVLEEQVARIAKQYAVDPLDLTFIGQEEKSDESKKETMTKQASIGIGIVKQMRQKIFLKPFRGENKMIVLENAQTLTTEAQNALLKVLEELPMHTLIVLLTDNSDSLLPTIQSRCQIIEIPDDGAVSEEMREESIQLLKDLDSMTVGKALSLSEKYTKDKKNCLVLLENVIIIFHEHMEKNSTDADWLAGYTHKMKSLLTLRNTLSSTNINTRLLLEVFFLSFNSDESYKKEAKEA